MPTDWWEKDVRGAYGRPLNILGELVDIDKLLRSATSMRRSTSEPSRVRPAPARRSVTDREAAVLRFLPTMMSNLEIASELFMPVNTVKTHLRSIYRKLGANDRREAVQRAREVQLLAPGVASRG